MIRISLTAAVLGISAAAAQAQAPLLNYDNLIPASQIEDTDIYALDLEETEWASESVFDAVNADWTVAGEVEDIVLDREGGVAGIIAEIDGGFLGIADRKVVLQSEDLRLVPEELGSNNWVYVTRYSQQALQELPEIEEEWWDD